MVVNKSNLLGIHITFQKAISPVHPLMFWMKPGHMLSIYTLTWSLPMIWIDLIMWRTLLHFFKVILHKTLEVGAKTYWTSYRKVIMHGYSQKLLYPHWVHIQYQYLLGTKATPPNTHLCLKNKSVHTQHQVLLLSCLVPY